MIDMSQYPDAGPWDPDYVEAAIRDAYASRADHVEEMKAAGWDMNPEAGDGPDGEIYTTHPSEDTIGYWFIKIVGRVGKWAASNPAVSEVGPAEAGWSDRDGYYWAQRILYPWKFADGGGGGDVASDGTAIVDVPAVPLSTKAAKGITPQLGLLEDDILYNLSLVAVNILEPLRQRYPNIIVTSGFRQVNNGISQHERGEAVDIQIRNQTPTLLYEVADYISKHLAFDQLVLNYTDAPVASWIHVSFSARVLRGEVLTRDFDDTFHHGLYLVTPLTGEARAAAEREHQQFVSQIDNELSILKSRNSKLNPPVVIGDPSVAAGNTATAGTTGTDIGTVPDERSAMIDVFQSIEDWGLDVVESCGQFVEAVAQHLGGNWGLLKAAAGDEQYRGHTIDSIAYKHPQANGLTVTEVKIIAGPGYYGAHPQWEPQIPAYEDRDWIAP